ncbi:MAG: hypothetical protein A2513_02810 [Sulfurimonas sp. RIFOXYD12_FULL_33_39]|uniref:hypothetical protein n=1 Tax=unclassified Sulfurimonas TaxID=2623549 RepID=UPI0008CB3060|nr:MULTISPECIES: hypothetical protein [unclassified Sulfurimonas]OHE08932.1 MAG: hypothetical protein A2513_02810 [Sulfurimonas sp. RIFOXYD12_FULL_33_39]OHE14242.1 MAG: hypothetical protein A2530_06110 [Sulfurimonas sp. RIFOXYD2_FULL_34_21]DAB28005.1 MAG TPA: hypothetical protein CFH78_04890 [Sulfurimonas sp. UBA10385]
MNQTELINELSSAAQELDHNRVSWIDKHYVIDLKNKALILIESIARFEEQEREAAMQAATEFLTEIEPVIQLLPKK